MEFVYETIHESRGVIVQTTVIHRIGITREGIIITETDHQVIAMGDNKQRYPLQTDGIKGITFVEEIQIGVSNKTGENRIDYI